MIKFGTGGWRAIIADEYTKENLSILCTAISKMMIDENKTDKFIAIGYDRRFLSKESAVWAAEVFAGHGISSRIIDREAPTPLIMFTVKTMDLNYGMAITASHNPALYNGVKLFTKGGRDADEFTTAKLETYIEKITAKDIKTMDYSLAKKENLVSSINPQNEYVDSILALVDIDKIKKARLSIVLDPMFGVSQTSIRTILAETRSELFVINDRHDTLFGGRLPAPNEDTLGALSSYVVENHCHMGVATDGDADRIGVIDEFGHFIDPNQLLVLLYYYLLKYRKWTGPVVRNNSTTHMLDRVAESFGEVCYEVPVGFKHISSKLEETGAIIGGESSGGLTVKGHILGKDGIYAVALLAEIIAVTGLKLSQLYKEITDIYGDCHLKSADFHLENMKEKEILMDKIYKEKVLPEFPYGINKISYQDGCKVYFKNGGWIIARFSGTEPLLRIASEMASETEANEVVNLFKKALTL